MLEVTIAGAGPELLLQLFPGDKSSRDFQQGEQDLDGLTRKLQARSILIQFARISGDLKGTKPHGNLRPTTLCHSSPQGGRQSTIVRFSMNLGRFLGTADAYYPS